MRTLLFVIVGACFAVAVALPLFKIARRAQRRTYWGCAALATLCGFFIGYPEPGKAVPIAALIMAAMTTAAFAYTPYLKIGGRIYALTVRDRQPDLEDAPNLNDDQPSPESAILAQAGHHPFDPARESYSGLLTPSTMWWLLVLLAALAAGNVYAYLFSDGGAAVAAAMAAFLALLAVGAGYGDASWRHPIARRQYLQFGVASLITAGGFALVYLIAYYVGQHRPQRRTRSLEHRAHPDTP
jgi:hypothetical protein